MLNTQKESFDVFFSQQLNAAQQQAVSPQNGVLLIIAGAGSGKTRVITSRIINLIVNHNVIPGSIIALTFTNKAAREMNERIDAFLQPGLGKPFIGTFHAYCLYLLRQHKQHLDIPDFTIMDSDDQQQLLQKLIKKNNLEKRITAKNLAYQISAIKNNNHVDNTEEQKNFYEPLIIELAQAYEKEKKLNKCFDFDDLLIAIYRLFTKNNVFRMQFQSKIRHILVDEYQDTNILQHALLKQMALYDDTFAIESLCAVGDEDQSIYSWRGATIANIIHFKKDFPQAITIKIEQNYRSVQHILDIANSVIQKNRNRNPKELWSNKKGVDRVHILSCSSGYQEAEALCSLLKVANQQQKLSTIAILYRAHYQSRVIEEALLRYSIAYKIIGGIQFYERKEIKDLLAYLKLMVNPFDRISFFRVINCPSRGLGVKFEEEFNTLWEQEPLYNFCDVAQQMLIHKQLTQGKTESLKQFIALFLSEVSNVKASECLEKIIKQTHYINYLKDTYDSQEAEAKIDNIKELARAVKYWEDQGNNTIEMFLHEIALMQEKITSQEHSENQVQLMTMHAAKGLEFDTVVLTGLEEGLFPSNHAIMQPATMEEERRLLYVGITRACERLFLMHTRFRYTFGAMTDQMPSRFLKEIPETLVRRHDCAKWNAHQYNMLFSSLFNIQTNNHNTIFTFGASTIKELPLKASKSSAWKYNQPISHAKFGIGIIKEIEHQSDDATYITAQFKNWYQENKIRLSTTYLMHYIIYPNVVHNNHLRRGTPHKNSTTNNL